MSKEVVKGTGIFDCMGNFISRVDFEYENIQRAIVHIGEEEVNKLLREYAYNKVYKKMSRNHMGGEVSYENIEPRSDPKKGFKDGYTVTLKIHKKT